MLQIIIRLLACFFTWSSAAAGEPSTIIASVKPLALLTEALAEGTKAQVKTLLPAHVSEHGYALKVSDIRALQAAHLVIWMGDDLEPYLAASKDRWQITENTRKSLALLEADSGSHDAHPADHHHEDPHRWLDPQQAIKLARQIADRLTLIFPEHSARIKSNLELLQQNILESDHQWKKGFEPYKNRPFVVFHDAYSHWAKYYSLRQLGVIYDSSGNAKGAKHQAALQDRIRHEVGVVCLFIEPQIEGASVSPALEAMKKLRRHQLDPLGMDAGSYIELMEALNSEALACFKNGR